METTKDTKHTKKKQSGHRMETTEWTKSSESTEPEK